LCSAIDWKINLPLSVRDRLDGRKGVYVVEVSGNWRITFRYAPDGAYDVNLEDYHS